MALDDIITRKYTNFRGVDFTGGNVPYYRSPDAKNMWRDYKDDDCIQTRPGMTLIDALSGLSGNIFGLFFLNKNNTTYCLIHKGTKLYKWTNYPTTPATTQEIKTGMNPSESKGFIFKENLYIIDGLNYLRFDGTNLVDVTSVATIPYTSYYRNPDGSSNLDSDTDTDTVYQPVNMLQPKRINRFIADGESTQYQLDSTDLDSAATYLMQGVIVNGDTSTSIVENIDFTVNRTKGVVTFTTAPVEDAIVTITLSKTTNGYINQITKCTLYAEFDNRIFFTGNPDHPNMVYHCQLNDVTYFADILQNTCGIDLANVKALVPGNNVLWVIKEIEQNSSSIHYLAPTYDESGNKVYADTAGSITSGCVSTGINFNDDVVFFSKNGLEGIKSSTMYSEQILAHRSSMVDAKMLSESDYKQMKLAEYKGYLMCLVNSHIYLADARQMFTNSTNEYEYEWFYWELPNTINFIKEYRDTLFLGASNGGLYALGGTTDAGTNIASYWTTKKDDMDYPGYTKTTNKRGGVANVKKLNNTAITLDTIVDGQTRTKDTYSDVNGYFPYRIKDKKFKEIQLKFSSNSRFGLFSCTLESFIAGYIKR